MAWLLRECWCSADPPPPPCRCRTGSYPRDDPGGRTWWQQITSRCPTHWPPLPTSVKIRIMVSEGLRL